jgi:DnaK suppressor protein
MTPGQKEELKAALTHAVEQTATEIAALEAKLEPVAPDCSLGRLTRLEAMGEQQVFVQTLGEARKRLNRLVFAVARFERESFGICEECEEPIAFDRMKIMPESTLCVACLNEREG